MNAVVSVQANACTGLCIKIGITCRPGVEYVFTVAVSKGSDGGPAWSPFRSDNASCLISTSVLDTPLISINPKVRSDRGFEKSSGLDLCGCRPMRAFPARLLCSRKSSARDMSHTYLYRLGIYHWLHRCVFTIDVMRGSFDVCILSSMVLLQETRRKYNPSSRLVLYGCAAASTQDRCSNRTAAGFVFGWDQVPRTRLPCMQSCLFCREAACFFLFYFLQDKSFQLRTVTTTVQIRGDKNPSYFLIIFRVQPSLKGGRFERV